MESPQKFYGPGDVPPAPVLFANAAQHVGVIAAINIAFPVLVVGALPPGSLDEGRYLGLAFLVLGIGTLLQSFPGRRIGSGLMVPTTFTAAYLPGILAAVEVGGLPLVCGMLLFAGIVEVILGIFIRRIRHIVTIEIAGLVILTIGLLLGMVGFRLVLSLNQEGAHVARDNASPLLGLCVLGVMVLASVYLPGRLKTLAALFGVVLGLLLSPLFGTVPGDALKTVTSVPIVGLPVPYLFWPAFEWSLVPPFLLAAFACAFRAAGDITNAQKSADIDWRRPDYGQISRGVVADGLTTIGSAAIGSLGANTFSGSVGLAAQAGVMSRRVAVVVGLSMIAIALLPPLRAVALLVPREVSGAVLIFSAAFIIMGGIRVIASRALNNQRILLVGLPLFLTTAHDANPTIFTELPVLFETFTHSDLTIAVFAALVLRFALGLHPAKKVTGQLPAPRPKAAATVVREASETLSISTDTADRAQFVVESLFEVLRSPAPNDEVAMTLAGKPDKVRMRLSIPNALIALPAAIAPAGELAGELTEAEAAHLTRVLGRADDVFIHRENGVTDLVFIFDE